MATWTDIRELANKLKAAQAKAGVFCLSERAWVDVIKHLVDIHRLKLVFTTDGHSYVTKQELEKEIREEVEAHNGRISLVELASNLDIESSTIEAKASELVAADCQATGIDRLLSIPGELLSKSYLRHVAQEIQDRLIERGQVTIGELGSIFSLPTALLTNVIDFYQDTLFHVFKFDERYITNECLAENRAKVRGYFTAITYPINLASVAQKLNISLNFLSSVVSSLINSGQLRGRLVANRGIYVPSCYSTAEDNYVKLFYAQNGYVEWGHLKKLGISDPGAYLRILLPDATQLSGMCISPTLLGQLGSLVEEAAHSGTWADLTHCLPAGLNGLERMKIVEPLIRTLPVKHVMEAQYVISDAFINECAPHFGNFIHMQSELGYKDRQSLIQPQQPAKVERDHVVSRISQVVTKSGFGIGARELKTKNVKRKYAPAKRRSMLPCLEDTELDVSKYLPRKELSDILENSLPPDVPREVIDGVIDLLLPQLESKFKHLVESIFIPNSSTTRRREYVLQTQETVNNMLLAMQLFERGIMCIDQFDLRAKLIRHLVRTHGAFALDRICTCLAQYHGICWPESGSKMAETDPNESTGVTGSLGQPGALTPLAAGQRSQFVDLLKRSGSPGATEAAVMLLEVMDKMLTIQPNSSGLREFYESVNIFATEHVGLSFSALHSRNDSKRKREERQKANELAIQVELQLVKAHQQMKISSTIEYASVVTVAASCLFAQVLTGWPVISPGKFVPDLIKWLCHYVSSMKQSLHPSTDAKSSSLPPAVHSLISSSAIDYLHSLSTHISQHMHSSSDFISDTGAEDFVDHILEAARSCRKLLYA